MPLSLQPKLLRVLEEKTIMPVGSTTPVKVNVRIIAASNRDLKAEVDGRVTVIHFEEGQRVEEGQLLLELDSGTIEATPRLTISCGYDWRESITL